MKEKRLPVVVLIAMVSSWPLVAKAQDPDYAGVESCKICHNPPGEGTPFKQWSESKHARALDALETEAAKETAKAQGIESAPHESASCMRCHVSAYDTETQKTPAKIAMLQGVQCETCHGPMSLHVADAKKAKITKKEIDKSLITVQPSQAVCVTCHNADSPTWDENRYTLEDGTTSGFDFEQAYPAIQHFKSGKAE